MTNPEIHVSASAGTLIDDVVSWLVRVTHDSIRDRGFAAWALSGGTTPIPLYTRLGREPGLVPWSSVRLYLVDDRDVNPADTLSNYGMIQRALLDPLGIAPLGAFPWMTTADPRAALARYRQHLSLLPRGSHYPQLDVTLQGMGGDGHTASVFPGSPQETSKDWVAYGPGPQANRFTLTLPLLAESRHVAFMVTGHDKAARVRECVQDAHSVLPAAWLSRNASGTVHWFLDAGSASLL